MHLKSAFILCILAPAVSARVAIDTRVNNPSFCETGRRQSPINIVSSAALPLGHDAAITFANYSLISDTPFTLMNYRYNPVVKVNVKDKTISGGGLSPSAKYVLELFNVHVGPVDGFDTGHQIDSVKYSGEMHFVHYNAAKYTGFATALTSGDPTAIAVLAVLIDVRDDGPRVPELSSIFENLYAVPHEGDTTTISSFDLMHLLPQQDALTNYFRYSGSGTTSAHCHEAVVWTVFSQPLYITSAQLNELRRLRSNFIGDKDESTIYHSRRVQPLNGRVVHRSH